MERTCFEVNPPATNPCNATYTVQKSLAFYQRFLALLDFSDVKIHASQPQGVPFAVADDARCGAQVAHLTVGPKDAVTGFEHLVVTNRLLQVGFKSRFVIQVQAPQQYFQSGLRCFGAAPV